MRKTLRTALFGAAAALVFSSTAWVTEAQSAAGAGPGQAPAAGPDQAPAATGQAPGRGGRGRGGRGRGGPVEPTPRLADGTVNFGRVPGEKGTWNVPYVTNMAMRAVGPDGQPLQAMQQAQAAARGGNAGAPGRGAQAPGGAAPARGAGARGAAGGGGRGRGGSKSEPWIPWMPWSAAVYDYNSLNESKYDPEGYCLPPGGPRMMATPYNMEILQLPEQKRIVMIFEGATHVWREIYMDGREFPEGDALNPTYLGYSIGHWQDKDTLVVENKGFNENSWLDYFGHPHTDLMKVTETWTRPNKQTLHYVAKIDDPGAYTEPFTVAWDVPWNANGELPEYICQENNRYLNRLEDDLGQPIFGPRPQPGQKPAAGTR